MFFFILLSFLALLIILTVIGNLLVCLSVILVKRLRKPQNYLLVSLAISDLSVAIFVMPFAILYEVNESWVFGIGLCDLWVSADVLSCTASILNLCAISVDRYQAILRPLEYSAKSSPKRMFGVIMIVWFSAASVSLPPMFLLGNENTHNVCTVSQNFWYQIYATMISFYVPLSVMIVVYARILRVVAKKKKEMEGRERIDSRTNILISPSQRDKRDAKTMKDHKASLTLGIIMSAFIVCWLPFFLLALVRLLISEEIPGWMDSLFVWLGYTNSALNPVIYATLNREFRKPFREILCCRCSTLHDSMRRDFYDQQFGSPMHLHRIDEVTI